MTLGDVIRAAQVAGLLTSRRHRHPVTQSSLPRPVSAPARRRDVELGGGVRGEPAVHRAGLADSAPRRGHPAETAPRATPPPTGSREEAGGRSFDQHPWLLGADRPDLERVGLAVVLVVGGKDQPAARAAFLGGACRNRVIDQRDAAGDGRPGAVGHILEAATTTEDVRVTGGALHGDAVALAILESGAIKDHRGVQPGRPCCAHASWSL